MNRLNQNDPHGSATRRWYFPLKSPMDNAYWLEAEEARTKSE